MAENREFRILSGIGIILVAAGHLGYDLFTVGGLFPYYSFHVFIFLFVSGYFYKEEAESQVGRYLVKKCAALLLPYYVWNLVYGIVTLLLHRAGFLIGEELSWYTLLIAPFNGGHQFMYQFPSWFVPVLFLIETVNVCMRKVLSWIRLKYEWLIFAGCLAAGMLTVWLAAGGHVWDLYKIPGRVLFMLPGFQLGRIYKEKLEKWDTLPNGIYFAVIIAVQIVVCIWTGGRLAFSAAWVSSFACGPVVPYLTVLTGIAFWLRISKLLAGTPFFSDLLTAVGRKTYAVMMHHVFVFFLIDGIFFLMHKYTAFCAEFDVPAFLADINYQYLPGGVEASKWIYLAAGVGLPVLLSNLWKRVRHFAASKQ